MQAVALSSRPYVVVTNSEGIRYSHPDPTASARWCQRRYDRES